MNFMVDAQLPRLLAVRLNELGQAARHTLDLSAGNRTSDHVIAELADLDEAVVISKDSDFLNSHLLHRKPAKLLLISTGTLSIERDAMKVLIADHHPLLCILRSGLLMLRTPEIEAAGNS
ncbi:MAG: DUF5615 family PIN-like protein [Verrucomicrobia bacterium]|nr:DUF5615 family PIN-like protein [Verrucomicrobiota bacterium]